jgi:hypothetical protein
MALTAFELTLPAVPVARALQRKARQPVQQQFFWVFLAWGCPTIHRQRHDSAVGA